MSSISVKEDRTFTHAIKDGAGDELVRVVADVLNKDQPIYVELVDPALSIDEAKRLIMLLQTAVDNYEKINK
jgi:hypothetical protein